MRRIGAGQYPALMYSRNHPHVGRALRPPHMQIFDGMHQTETMAQVQDEHALPMPIGSLKGKGMAGSATGAAQENPLQICAVAHGDSARRASVRGNVVFMKQYICIPSGRMC